MEILNEKNARKFDINERLINLAVSIIRVCESVNTTKSGVHLTSQLLRSGNSPALNYGEAQSAESRNDFIHKFKIALKELRESYNSLQIIQRAELSNNVQLIEQTSKECNELIAILVKSIETAQKNNHDK
jgi:four helix bundle protein